MDAKKRRIHLLDEIRGFAVFCMVFYHLFYVLGINFGFSFMQEAESFFAPLQPPFACAFIFISGISSRLSHSNFARGTKLLAVALAFSAVSVWLLPLFGLEDCAVRFGILSLLSVSMLIFAALRPLLDKIPPALGVAVFFILYLLTFGVQSGYLGFSPVYGFPLPEGLYRFAFLSPLGFSPDGWFSADYFPLLPNLFMFLAGSCLGVYAVRGDLPEGAYVLRCRVFSFIGRHALIIYLAHWPLLFILGLISSKF